MPLGIAQPTELLPAVSLKGHFRLEVLFNKHSDNIQAGHRIPTDSSGKLKVLERSFSNG